MINAPRLYTHNLVTDLFGHSKCYVTAHVLRDLGLYPKRRELTYREAAIYLYCLAASPGTDVEASVQRAAEEVTHIKLPNGQSFIDMFTMILKNESFHSLRIIMFSQTGGMAYIEASDGIDAVYLDERKPGAFLANANFYTGLPKNYLKFYAAIIKERNLTYEQLN
ncbi:hypothetical protein WJR50_11475 [Catalinimonas sp. 4WD22]|uniref:hypothetical protein n=1 Tax=Catalinimonas locisalis TaxID=3133978 RepID=UPI0031015597